MIIFCRTHTVRPEFSNKHLKAKQFFPDLGIIKKIFYIKENLTVDLHNKTLSEEINFLLQFLNDFFDGFREHLHIEETFILL